MKAKVVVCASGDGSNFQALVEAAQRGQLQADIVGLIANKPGIGALNRAQNLNVPAKILPAKNYTSFVEWDLAFLRQLRDWQAEWVVLAGFLALIGPQVLAAFPKRILNSHPSLLPKFGGQGMYGQRVHQAVIEAGELETGITFHWVEAEYDRGAVISQFRLAVNKGETPTQLAERVKCEENRLYPRVLEDLLRSTQ